MVKRSRLDIGHRQRGDNVAIPIPLVDRGRGNPRNILGVILDRSENDNYTLVTKHGILKGAYTRNEFELCPQKLLSLSEMNCVKHVSLREAVILGSQSGGQGYVKCNCSGAKKCQNNQCKCFKAKLKCNNIDECAEASENTCQQVCTNIPGSYVCSCHAGYTYDNTNNTCVDIDECLTNTDYCEYECENFPGTANCICGPGFALNDDRRTCDKKEDPCQKLASSRNCSYACQVVNGSPHCYCRNGYQLAADGVSCDDINECVGSHRCSQVCHNTAGNYRCSCSTDYTLDNDQRTCVVCDRNHWGENCNMTCNCDSLGSQRCDGETGCVCRSGWQGVRCDEDLHECSGDPCANLSNSQCVDTVGSFRCQCHDGYMNNSARNACVDIKECGQAPSPCDQQCSNTEGSYTCSCGPGFQSKGTDCVDIDECRTKPCEQICRNTLGGYSCECQTGYLLNSTTRNTCYDKDECLTNPCDQTCTNTPGSYFCECRSGYRLNATTKNTCDDINECESGACVKGSCENTPGNFTCTCPPGFLLSSDRLTCQACDDVHYGKDCSSQCACARANTADCHDVSGACTCKTGWTREDCTQDVDECTSSGQNNPCQTDKHETCRNTQGGYSCDCDTGYVRVTGSGQGCADIKMIAGASGAAVFGIAVIIVVVFIIVKKKRRRQTNAPCGGTRRQNEQGESMHNALANPRGLQNKEGQGHCYASNKAYEGGQLPPPDYASDNFAGAVEDFTSPPAPGLDRRKMSD
ncbi:hypothetical protein ACOMHN_062700 [Nucella lapillus]